MYQPEYKPMNTYDCEGLLNCIEICQLLISSFNDTFLICQHTRIINVQGICNYLFSAYHPGQIISKDFQSKICSYNPAHHACRIKEHNRAVHWENKFQEQLGLSEEAFLCNCSSARDPKRTILAGVFFPQETLGVPSLIRSRFFFLYGAGVYSVCLSGGRASAQ